MFAADSLNSEARDLISGLPVRPDANSFYNLVDISTESNRAAWRAAADRLLGIGSFLPRDDAFVVLNWAADALTGVEDIRAALLVKPVPVVGSRSLMQTDRLLSLKHAAGAAVTGLEVATLFGPKLTSFGRENIDAITVFLEARISQLQMCEDRDLLGEWAVDAHPNPVGTNLFWGHARYVVTPQVRGYGFSVSKTAETMCLELMREAENTFREERDVPNVGEGWVAETALYHAIKQAFAGEEVIHHGRLAWLGGQHLDVYLPTRNVAVEYQGPQHDRPIAFFGGEAAYLENKERDRTKRRKCMKQGVHIVYVREGYLLADVIAEIQECSSDYGVATARYADCAVPLKAFTVE